MDTTRPQAADSSLDSLPSGLMSRRSILRAGALTGGGLMAAALAACAPVAAAPTWTYPPAAPAVPGAPSAAPSDAHATHLPTVSAGDGAASPAPADHDAAALAVVKRFLDGEGAKLAGTGNQRIEPTRIDGGVKVFEMTIDRIQHRIDALKEPIDALGYNGTWPAPRIEVVE